MESWKSLVHNNPGGKLYGVSDRYPNEIVSELGHQYFYHQLYLPQKVCLSDLISEFWSAGTKWILPLQINPFIFKQTGAWMRRHNKGSFNNKAISPAVLLLAQQTAESDLFAGRWRWLTIQAELFCTGKFS